jgi:hypothetical protein
LPPTRGSHRDDRIGGDKHSGATWFASLFGYDKYECDT